ncbi:SDR family NAD(P)-dependent oxidoreductase [Flavihumibacter sediminis]|nr:SDR family NAD(P)-dependent oxidoreductase [Flavihumibacter sediminis]
MSKIAMITGATAGFGKACAEKFAAGGYDLIVTGRRAEKLDYLCKQIRETYSVKCFPLVFDVRNKNEVKQAVDSIPGEFSKIDLLINNAGLALGRDYFDEADMDDWETMIDTNLKGLLYVSRAVLPHLKQSANAHIINIGSIAGKEVYEKGNVYCASKHAVDAISKAMRIDLLRLGIKVTAIHPGAADTEFSIVRFKGDAEKAAAVYTGYEPLRAEDIADTAWYCASLPPHVCINDLVIMATAQANSYLTFKK